MKRRERFVILLFVFLLFMLPGCSKKEKVITDRVDNTGEQVEESTKESIVCEYKEFVKEETETNTKSETKVNSEEEKKPKSETVNSPSPRASKKPEVSKKPDASKKPIDTDKQAKDSTLKEEGELDTVDGTEKYQQSVTLSITGVEDQTQILSACEVELKEGDTVFTLLLRETKARKIQMEFSGGKKAAYIQGIDNLYEMDKGELSGWMYLVNGEFPSVSCSEYILMKGDIVEWKYTLDLGKDLGAKDF